MSDLSPEEFRREMYESVAKGDIEIVGERDGEPVFAVTKEGEERVEAMLDHYLDQLVEYVAGHLGVPEFVARDLLFRRAKILYEVENPEPT